MPDKPAGDALPPAVDIELVKKQMGSFDEGTIEMLHMFIDLTAPMIGKMQEMVDHDDYQELRNVAHSLKGSARSACCMPLGDLAAQLQDDADERKESCAMLVEQIAVEFERAADAIKSLQAA